MTESPLIGEAIQFGYKLVEDRRYQKALIKILLWAGAGLILGLFLGLATA